MISLEQLIAVEAAEASKIIYTSKVENNNENSIFFQKKSTQDVVDFIQAQLSIFKSESGKDNLRTIYVKTAASSFEIFIFRHYCFSIILILKDTSDNTDIEVSCIINAFFSISEKLISISYPMLLEWLKNYLSTSFSLPRIDERLEDMDFFIRVREIILRFKCDALIPLNVSELSYVLYYGANSILSENLHSVISISEASLLFSMMRVNDQVELKLVDGKIIRLVHLKADANICCLIIFDRIYPATLIERIENVCVTL